MSVFRRVREAVRGEIGKEDLPPTTSSVERQQWISRPNGGRVGHRLFESHQLHDR
jgi:hypothetical protein